MILVNFIYLKRLSMSPNKNVYLLFACSYTDTLTRDGVNMGTSGQISLGSHPGFADYQLTESVRTPNYRRLKRGSLPWQPYLYNQRTSHAPVGPFIQKAVQGGDIHINDYRCTVVYLGESLDIVPEAIQADDPTQRAIRSLITGYKDPDGDTSKDIQGITQVKASNGVALGELNKTVAHVASSATRIFLALKALRNGRFGDFTTALGVTATTKGKVRFDRAYKNRYRSKKFDTKRGTYLGGRPVTFQTTDSRTRDFMASTWLEYTYGWKPLLQDVYGTAEALGQQLIQRQGVVREARSSATNRLNSNLSELSSNKLYYTITKAQSSKRTKFVIQYRIPDGAVSNLVAFGLNNPALVAWELVPFSFVVDWFIPIGNAIEALTAFDGLVFHRGSKAVKHVFYRQVSQVPSGRTEVIGGVSYTRLSNSPGLEDSRLYKKREILSTFPSYGWPKWKDPRSLSHGASAIALLHSIFLSKGGRTHS